MESPLLSVENVTVSFDGFNALDGMSLRLMPASIRVLVGPNGAGKSTLLDAIIGHVRPSVGQGDVQGPRDYTHERIQDCAQRYLQKVSGAGDSRQPDRGGKLELGGATADGNAGGPSPLGFPGTCARV